MHWHQKSPIVLSRLGSLFVPALNNLLDISYRDRTLVGTIQKSGHETTIAFDGAPAVATLDGRTARLVELHAHTGPEHDMAGRGREVVELHLVHKFEDEGVPAGAGLVTHSANLVVGFHLRSSVQANACAIVEGGTSISIDMRALLPSERFYRYEGALTNRTQQESVSWVFYDEVRSLSADDLGKLACLANHPEASTHDPQRRFVLRSFE